MIIPWCDFPYCLPPMTFQILCWRGLSNGLSCLLLLLLHLMQPYDLHKIIPQCILLAQFLVLYVPHAQPWSYTFLKMRLSKLLMKEKCICSTDKGWNAGTYFCFSHWPCVNLSPIPCSVFLSIVNALGKWSVFIWSRGMGFCSQMAFLCNHVINQLLIICFPLSSIFCQCPTKKMKLADIEKTI